MNTKFKIIKEAISLFNKEGYNAVSMQELAQKLSMSRGNLTYHFRDKDTLLKVIAEQMWAKMELERQRTRKLPSFENIHNEVLLHYKIQKQFAFIFIDPHVLKHPIIKKQFREMTQEVLQDFKEGMAFAIKLGNMKEEEIPGTYYNIAFISWMLSFFWLSQQIIRGKKTGDDGEKMVWSILLQHFTSKGIRSFKNFFGEDYYRNLGKPFDKDLTELIVF